MLGLPFSESMRCRLLAGIAVAAASPSNPTVAFTRSRRMRRAVRGSPLRNSVAASSSIALAKAGSRCTRSTTLCLKSRVSAMPITSCFVVLRRVFAPLLRKHCLRSFDIGLLPRLRAAAQQDDQRFPILGEIDPIARSPINAVLGDDADPLHARCVAHGETQRRRGD